MSISNAFGDNDTFHIYHRHLNMNQKKIINLADPLHANEASSKGYVEGYVAGQVNILLAHIQALEQRIQVLENKSVSVESKLDTAFQ